MFLKFPVVFSQSLMKEKIIQKAGEMFITLGFKSVTMDDIAQEMGISKKTIYTHFDNKTNLVRETVTYLFHTISCEIDEIRAEEKNPIEELYEIKKLVLMHLKYEKSSPQYQLQKYYPEIHDTIKAMHFEKMHCCTLENLEKGVKKKLYRENLDIDFIARIYFIGMNGIKDDSIFPVQKFPKISLYEAYLEYHLRGIVTKEGLKILNTFINQTIHNA